MYDCSNTKLIAKQQKMPAAVLTGIQIG